MSLRAGEANVVTLSLNSVGRVMPLTQLMEYPKGVYMYIQTPIKFVCMVGLVKKQNPS